MQVSHRKIIVWTTSLILGVYIVETLIPYIVMGAIIWLAASWARKAI